MSNESKLYVCCNEIQKNSFENAVAMRSNCCCCKCEMCCGSVECFWESVSLEMRKWRKILNKYKRCDHTTNRNSVNLLQHLFIPSKYLGNTREASADIIKVFLDPVSMILHLEY